MRHRKGYRRVNNSQKTISNNIDVKGYTYIGRCRCGYGPNAYYQDQSGRTFSARQVLQTPRPPVKSNSILSNSEASQKRASPKVELHRICNNCGAQVRDDAYFCTECGNVLGEPSFLPKKDQIEILKNQIKELKDRIKILKRSG
ncbi:MAG: zinc-ribbon domain-containing protein [Candidatus Helarchaeota archaeon]